MSKRIRVKPGKGESMLGFVAGAIFICVGLFVVIPNFGPFGLLWTLFAIGITVFHGINAFSKRGVTSHEVIFEDDSRMEGSSQREEKIEESIEARLNTLQRLYDSRTITSEEYQEKRKEILKDL